MADNLVTAAVVTLAADAIGVASAAGNWIKIAPRGAVKTRDGRSYNFNPETLAARFVSDDVKVPIDFEHGIAKLAAKGQRTDAIGWIEDMQARPDGLYGHVEWLDAGKAALTAKTHRYVSPTFPHDHAGNAQFIHSVALVTAPALSKMPAVAHAIASQSGEEDAMLLAKIRAMLSLPQDASEEDALAAIKELTTAKLAAMDGSVQRLIADLAKEKGELRTRTAIEKADKAIAQGAFPPYMRDWAIATCSANEAAFDAFLGQVGRPMAHLFANAFTPEKAASLHKQQPDEPSSAAAELIAEQLGISPESLRKER